MVRAPASIPVRAVTDDERRARLGRRHHLSPADPAPVDVAALARDLAGFHATDPATVYLSIHARLPKLSIAAIDQALWADRRIAKHLCMRRTLFCLPLDLVPAAHAAASVKVAADARKSLVLHLGWAGVDNPETFLDAAMADTVAALDRVGEATTAQLADLVPALRQEVDPAPGKAYGGPGRISNRVLTLLDARGLAVRTQPIGGMTSSLVRWAPARSWFPDGIAPLTHAQGTAIMVDRWLQTYGPGTVDDITWWLGGTKTATAAALAAVAAVPVALDDSTTGWLHPDDVDPVATPAPWVALLPGLDPAPMGWKSRDWYLGPHKAHVFDTNGNVGPTVWVDGRIVGSWAHRKDGTVVWQVVEDVAAAVQATITARAADLQHWLGDVRVTPRFPVPLQKALVAD